MLSMSKKQRPDGWWYPWLFVGAFGIVFTVNGIMVYFAVSSWTGLETKNYYKASTDYNSVLAQRAKQTALGWVAEFSYENTPVNDDPRAGMYHLRFTDKTGTAIEGLTITAKAVRPTHEGYDQSMSFIERGNGNYTASATLPLPGQWELRYAAQSTDELFKMRQRIVVK